MNAGIWNDFNKHYFWYGRPPMWLTCTQSSLHWPASLCGTGTGAWQNYSMSSRHLFEVYLEIDADRFVKSTGYLLM